MISFEEINRQAAKAAERKAKRQEKGMELGLRRKRTHKTADRRAVFNRLERNCREFVLLRAEFRGHGFCEVGVACRGFGPIEVWYHIFPQQLGNGTKYDHRAILGSCRACNNGENEARRSKGTLYVSRHLLILGPEYDYLEALTGRRQISTVEAAEMAECYRHLIATQSFSCNKAVPFKED